MGKFNIYSYGFHKDTHLIDPQLYILHLQV